MDSSETGWADDKSQRDDGIPIWPLAERRALKPSAATLMREILVLSLSRHMHMYLTQRECEHTDHLFHTNCS